ncbi:hypothetical protein MCEREM21A_02963 [Sphingomonadaceae bacterium]
MDKRKVTSELELIILQFPMTLALALISNRDQNTDGTFLHFLMLLYIYWFIIFIWYSYYVDNFVIMPSSIWEKALLFLCAPIGLMFVNMVFMALSIIPVQSTLELFGLL